MSEQKLIEFVCTANQGRSPVAELIAKNHLKLIEVLQYTAISSGSHLDALRKRKPSVDFMKKTIGTAGNRKDVQIYSPTDLASIDEAIKQGNNAVIKPFYDMAVNFFKNEELEHRGKVLKYFGIEGKVKETREQTIARPDTIAIFPMAENNTEAVRNIYDTSPYQPKLIESLDVINAFGSGKDVYIDCIAQLVEKVPKAIDQVLAYN